MVGYSGPLLPGFIRRRYTLRFGVVLGVLGLSVGGMALGLGRTTVYQVPTDLVAAAVGGILVGGLFGALMIRRAMNSVASIRSAAEELRDGNLDVDFDRTRVDGIGRLADSLAGLRDTVREQRMQNRSDRTRFEDRQRRLEATADEYTDRLESALTDPSVRLQTDVQSDTMATVGVACNELLRTRQERRDELAEVRRRADELEAERDRLARENQVLTDQAVAHAEVVEGCVDGDLTRRMDEDVDSPVAARLAVGFNELVSTFEEATVEADSFAAEVATVSNEITVSAAEVRDGSERVSASLNSISDATERQFETLDDVVSDMTDLSAAIQEIDASSSDVAELAQQTVETGRVGREAATEAIDGMKEIEQESVDTVEEIERLESTVQQIDQLIEFIREVAEQTNMLALNANIEASRAGESGQGFAVVAREIKELAKGTKDAAADIETRLEEIQTRTSETVAEVRETREQIARHTDSVENAADALNEIAENAHETNAGVQDVSSVMSQQAHATQAVLSAVDGAKTGAETVEEATTAARGAEEQTRALGAVSDRADALSTQATRLKTTFDPFETERRFAAGVDAATPDEGPAAPPGGSADIETAAEDPEDEGTVDDDETTAEETADDDETTAEETADDDEDLDALEGFEPPDAMVAEAATGTGRGPHAASQDGADRELDAQDADERNLQSQGDGPADR